MWRNFGSEDDNVPYFPKKVNRMDSKYLQSYVWTDVYADCWNLVAIC